MNKEEKKQLDELLDKLCEAVCGKRKYGSCQMDCRYRISDTEECAIDIVQDIEI